MSEASTAALWWAVALSGIYHGLNPGMGWPLAVSAALMERRSSALVSALGMLALGHFLAMAVILLPLLGFTRSGQRLGMGGGYYDRSLAFRIEQAAPPLLIGVGYAFQELDCLPGEAWDVTLDAVVTEREFIVR